jgi:D-galactarolactone cycloisomerase
MKITHIWSAGLRGSTPAGGWANELKPTDCVHTLIAVKTDDGVIGWGSVYTNDVLVKGALLILAPLCIGENPLDVERVTEKLHAHTFWTGRGGSVTHTISGINIALWDILGKATGQPAGRLLGGRYRDRVRPYASLLMDEPDRLRDTLISLREKGFRAFKIGWGRFGRVDDKLDERIVKTAREAVGQDAMLMVDAGASDAFWPNGYKWALRAARMLEQFEVSWFEEPLPPDSLEDFVLLRQAAAIPISGGEVLTRRQAFEPWIRSGALDIIQPDATKVGGLSEFRRIAWMAEDRGMRVIPHGWNTAIGLAADLQLASANRTTDLIEYLAGSPFIDELSAKPWSLDSEGMLAIPESPGLGITLDIDAVERYSGVRCDASSSL